MNLLNRRFMPLKCTASWVRADEPWREAGTVLTADDEECVRNVARPMVVRMGFRVLLAADGRDAGQIYAKHTGQIGCVLLDLTLGPRGMSAALQRLQ
jgi:two-component system cell cycle sensor histidine kinase/response regulator CckA